MYEIGHLDGLAAFDVDGFHILPTSDAMQRGLNAGVHDDVDGNPMPDPLGTAPDLGADENSTLRIFHLFVPLVRRH